MHKLFKGIYEGKKVFLTGHTGFKGSWLLLWLKQLGAEVKGYSLPPSTNPSHIQILRLFETSSTGDIRKMEQLKKTLTDFQPDIIFHLAAQPLVRKSYVDPLETFHTNVIGTANVLEAARHLKSLKTFVNITTDKVYHNNEWPWPYRETDTLGGHDPYSTSKACVELLHESYQKSFFLDAGILSATARAGNVIGGGDWADDRLIPDIIKTASKLEVANIRNPYSIRPWQHVLDPLSGYLLLAQGLLEGNKKMEGAWNFGPQTYDCLTVASVLDEFKSHWTSVQWKNTTEKKKVHESNLLMLDCSKAMNTLSWSPVWNVKTAIAKTAEWYKQYYTNKIIQSENDLQQYIDDARSKKLIWTL